MNLFIGNFIEVLEEYHKTIGVDIVISENGKADDSIIEYCERNSISLYLVESKVHFKRVSSSIARCELCIVASFGLLLDNTLLSKIEWVVNIHPGDLLTCRGRHPLPFSIKQGLPFMSITAHIIEDGKIDNGPVVATLSLPIDYNQTYAYNDNKIRANLSFITRLIIFQYKNEGRILTGKLDLSNAPYNKRLDGETLSQIIDAKNLLEYSRQSGNHHQNHQIYRMKKC